MGCFDSLRQIRRVVVALWSLQGVLLWELIFGGHSACGLGLRLVAHGFHPTAGKDGKNHAQCADTMLLVFLDCRSVKAPLTSRTKACDVGKTLRVGEAKVLFERCDLGLQCLFIRAVLHSFLNEVLQWLQGNILKRWSLQKISLGTIHPNCRPKRGKGGKYGILRVDQCSLALCQTRLGQAEVQLGS